MLWNLCMRTYPCVCYLHGYVPGLPDGILPYEKLGKICYKCWYNLWPFGIFSPFWYAAPRKIWQPCCYNPLKHRYIRAHMSYWVANGHNKGQFYVFARFLFVVQRKQYICTYLQQVLVVNRPIIARPSHLPRNGRWLALFWRTETNRWGYSSNVRESFCLLILNGVFMYTIRQILVKIVSYDIWNCCTAKIGFILSVKIESYDTICRIV
jgi:hypothetical protein